MKVSRNHPNSIILLLTPMVTWGSSHEYAQLAALRIYVGSFREKEKFPGGHQGGNRIHVSDGISETKVLVECGVFLIYFNIKILYHNYGIYLPILAVCWSIVRLPMFQKPRTSHIVLLFQNLS